MVQPQQILILMKVGLEVGLEVGEIKYFEILCQWTGYVNAIRRLSYLLQTGMCGMKRDCGGAAAVLGAFKTAVKLVSH